MNGKVECSRIIDAVVNIWTPEALAIDPAGAKISSSAR